MFVKIVYVDPHFDTAHGIGQTHKCDCAPSYSIYANVSRASFVVSPENGELAHIWRRTGEGDCEFLTVVPLAGQPEIGERAAHSVWVLNDKGETVERYFPRVYGPANPT